MRKVLYSIVVPAAIVLSSCGEQPKTEALKSTETSSATYVCPMNCEGELTHSEKEKCAVCHMDLEIVK